MTEGIKEYALELLKQHGCDLNIYADGTTYGGYDNALSDLRNNAIDNEITFPYPIEDIARELVTIGNENRPPAPYIFPDFNDWGHWGISGSIYDFYDNGTILNEAIKSGQPFDTGWHGFKKELESLRIVRHSDLTYTVCVFEEMDSLCDNALIFDCLNDEEGKIITDEMIEEIKTTLLLDVDFCEECSLSKDLPQEATIEDMLNEAVTLIRECHDALHQSFLDCMGTTLYVLYGYPENTEFIQKRIEQNR